MMLYEKPVFLYIQGGRKIYSKPVRKNFRPWKPYVRKMPFGYRCAMEFGNFTVYGYGKSMEFAYWNMFRNEKMMRKYIDDMLDLPEPKSIKRWWEFWK